MRYVPKEDSFSQDKRQYVVAEIDILSNDTNPLRKFVSFFHTDKANMFDYQSNLCKEVLVPSTISYKGNRTKNINVAKNNQVDDYSMTYFDIFNGHNSIFSILQKKMITFKKINEELNALGLSEFFSLSISKDLFEELSRIEYFINTPKNKSSWKEEQKIIGKKPSVNNSIWKKEKKDFYKEYNVSNPTQLLNKTVNLKEKSVDVVLNIKDTLRVNEDILMKITRIVTFIMNYVDRHIKEYDTWNFSMDEKVHSLSKDLVDYDKYLEEIEDVNKLQNQQYMKNIIAGFNGISLKSIFNSGNIAAGSASLDIYMKQRIWNLKGASDFENFKMKKRELILAIKFLNNKEEKNKIQRKKI